MRRTAARIALVAAILLLGFHDPTLAVTQPFVCPGGFDFNPMSDFTFDTDSAGSTFVAGSNVEDRDGNLTPVTYRLFPFNNITIASGVTIRATGSRPLILCAIGTINIAGTVDISGTAGSSGNPGDVNFGAGGGGGGAGGGALCLSAGSMITISASGKILATGGDGGLGGDDPFCKGDCGLGGIAVAGGGDGGGGGQRVGRGRRRRGWR